MELTDTSYLYIDESDVLTGPLHIAVDVTNKCNARCLHCYNRSGGLLSRDELTDDDLLLLYQEISSIKPFSVCFCGGEPMLRYDVICEATKKLKAAGVPVVSMVSNGWFIDEEKAKGLIDAGMTNVQISLDGACAATHEHMRGLEGLFDRAIGALNILDNLGITLQVAFSPTRFNIDEFPEIVELLSSLKNLNELRVQPLMPMGVALEHEEELFPDDEDYRKLTKYINAKKSKREVNFNIAWGDPLDHMVRFPTFDFKNNSFLEVKSNGDITVSSYLPLTIGNVKHHSLSEYWEAGIGKAWSLPVAKELAASVVSVSDMKFESGSTPTTFYEQNIELDFIEDKVLDNPSQFTLESLYQRSKKND